jgi:hypothetical protein
MAWEGISDSSIAAKNISEELSHHRSTPPTFTGKMSSSKIAAPRPWLKCQTHRRSPVSEKIEGNVAEESGGVSCAPHRQAGTLIERIISWGT